VYQGRYRASAIGSSRHYFHVMRYVEANALRAGLVSRAEDWKWSSLHERLSKPRLICDGPERLPALSQWLDEVNRPMTPEEISQARWRR
jgi:putative transposase